MGNMRSLPVRTDLILENTQKGMVQVHLFESFKQSFQNQMRALSGDFKKSMKTSVQNQERIVQNTFY